VSHNDWGSVEWLADVAETHPDTLGDEGRADKMEYLRGKVTSKLREMADDSPPALDRLGGLLGLQHPDEPPQNSNEPLTPA
jgi:hypothetical protein